MDQGTLTALVIAVLINTLIFIGCFVYGICYKDKRPTHPASPVQPALDGHNGGDQNHADDEEDEESDEEDEESDERNVHDGTTIITPLQHHQQEDQFMQLFEVELAKCTPEQFGFGLRPRDVHKSIFNKWKEEMEGKEESAQPDTGDRPNTNDLEAFQALMNESRLN